MLIIDLQKWQKGEEVAEPWLAKVAEQTLAAYSFPVTSLVSGSDGQVIHSLYANVMLDTADKKINSSVSMEEAHSDVYLQFLEESLAKAKQVGQL